jgi:hypothetical protein
MAEIPPETAFNTCRGITASGSPCRRSLPPSESYCYQHSKGLVNRIRYLHRNSKGAFWTTIVLAVVLGIPSIYLSYLGVNRSSTPVEQDANLLPVNRFRILRRLIPTPPPFAYDRLPTNRQSEGIRSASALPGLKVTFTNSPLLTPPVRRTITLHLARFSAYLADLGIVVPKETPPIGTTAIVVEYGTSVLDAPVYLGAILVGEQSINRPAVITAAYSEWAFGQLLMRPHRSKEHPTHSVNLASVVATYYNLSFWDLKKPEQNGRDWVFALLEVRQKSGKDFTDRMVAYTFRSICDTPEDSSDLDFDSYFAKRLQVGDYVVDTMMKNWPDISEILRRDGHLVPARQ